MVFPIVSFIDLLDDPESDKTENCKALSEYVM